MKWGIILVLCILVSLIYVSAEDITLGVGESHVKGNIRITLAKIGMDYDKVVLCVNNEKQILYEDQLAYFKNTSLEVKHIDEEDRNVEIDIDWLASCIDCKCDGDCLNDKCKIGIYDEFGNLLETKIEESDTVETEEAFVENDDIDIVEENVEVNIEEVLEHKPNYVLATSIPLIGILAGLILVWLFWFRKMSF